MNIKKYLVLVTIVCVALAIASCAPAQTNSCNHDWKPATCTEPRTCSLCYETQGNPAGHTGGKATCTEKAVCSVCNSEYGELDAGNHTGNVSWQKTANNHCEAYTCCGTKVSEVENHTKLNGICSICGFDPIIGVSSVNLSEDGNTATVVISIMDNPGILGLEMTLSFDGDALTLVDAKNGDAMKALAFTAPDDFSKGGKFLWDGMVAGEAKNGEVLILTFDVSDAPTGSYSLLIKAASYDSELNHLTFKIENGKIDID